MQTTDERAQQLAHRTDNMEKDESPLDVLSRAATMVSPPSYDEARSYSSKELPSAKWRKERRGNLHSRGGGDGPLDFSSRAPPPPPPSYDQSIRYKNNSSRPSVIQSVVQPLPHPAPTPAPVLAPQPSPPLEDVCDPAIDEHFRRSLGKDYSSIFSPVKKEAQVKTNESDSAGLSVDDHFAKALGDTWTKLKEQESLERSKSNLTGDPLALKKKNKDTSMLNDKRRAVVTTT